MIWKLRVILLFGLSLCGFAPHQETVCHSLQEALDSHVKELKTRINGYDNIFVVTNLKNASTSDKLRIVESGLNARFLQSGDRNYLVEVRVDMESVNTKLYISNFRVYKKSNTKIELSNLNNGQTYIIRR